MRCVGAHPHSLATVPVCRVHVSCRFSVCRPGLTKVQLAEISVQCKELHSKALKQQAAAGYGGQLPALLPASVGADPGAKGWRFWKS